MSMAVEQGASKFQQFITRALTAEDVTWGRRMGRLLEALPESEKNELMSPPWRFGDDFPLLGGPARSVSEIVLAPAYLGKGRGAEIFSDASGTYRPELAAYALEAVTLPLIAYRLKLQNAGKAFAPREIPAEQLPLFHEGIALVHVAARLRLGLEHHEAGAERREHAKVLSERLRTADGCESIAALLERCTEDSFSWPDRVNSALAVICDSRRYGDQALAAGFARIEFQMLVPRVGRAFGDLAEAGIRLASDIMRRLPEATTDDELLTIFAEMQSIESAGLSAGIEHRSRTFNEWGTRLAHPSLFHAFRALDKDSQEALVRTGYRAFNETVDLWQPGAGGTESLAERLIGIPGENLSSEAMMLIAMVPQLGDYLDNFDAHPHILDRLRSYVSFIGAVKALPEITVEAVNEAAVRPGSGSDAEQEYVLSPRIREIQELVRQLNDGELTPEAFQRTIAIFQGYTGKVQPQGEEGLPRPLDRHEWLRFLAEGGHTGRFPRQRPREENIALFALADTTLPVNAVSVTFYDKWQRYQDMEAGRHHPWEHAQGEASRHCPLTVLGELVFEPSPDVHAQMLEEMIRGAAAGGFWGEFLSLRIEQGVPVIGSEQVPQIPIEKARAHINHIGLFWERVRALPREPEVRSRYPGLIDAIETLT